MNIERGSVWRKWDFHVHTPYSILNNNYGVNPYEEQWNEAQFDAYVVALFTKAVENGVAAIGITDYFSIDGYRHIQNSYIRNEEKMVQLFPDDELRSKVYQILLLPNIEMRTDNFVGKGAHAVNYHVIFSNTLSPEDIEECFLNSLQFPYQAGKTLPLTRRNIERLGAEYKASNGGTGSDYRIGLERVTVSY